MLARRFGRELLDHIAQRTLRIDILKKTIGKVANRGATSRRLQTMPGVGPIGALALETFAPPMEQLRRGRDFAAWLGLVPRQSRAAASSGLASKMGQRDIRRLLITGAMAVIRWATRSAAPEGSWLARMLAKKPRVLVAIALANRMARGIWANADEAGGLQKSGDGARCMIQPQRSC